MGLEVSIRSLFHRGSRIGELWVVWEPYQRYLGCFLAWMLGVGNLGVPSYLAGRSGGTVKGGAGFSLLP